MIGFSYSRFEGIGTPWRWLDKLLCRLLGHPERNYMICTSKEVYEVCARCCERRDQ